MALELIFTSKHHFSETCENPKEILRFCPPETSQNEPRCLQDGLWTALGQLWVALGPLLAALGSLLVALGSLLVALGSLLAPLGALLVALKPLLASLGALLVALEPLWARSKPALPKPTRGALSSAKASLLSIAPVMGLVLLDPVLVALIPRWVRS